MAVCKYLLLSKQIVKGSYLPITQHNLVDCFGLYGQATKRTRWMPWQSEAMKDVVTCDKPRGVCKLTLIRGFPNGETHLIY